LEKRLSIAFALLIGAPRVYAMAAWFALGAVGVTAIGGLVAAFRTGRISTAAKPNCPASFTGICSAAL
jgi:hypothetical protein